MRLAKDHYLKQLEQYLKNRDFNSFEKLANRLKDDSVSLDLTRIPEIEKKISNCFIYHLENGINIEGMLQVLRFAATFQLISRTKKKHSLSFSERESRLIILNLQSLFDETSEGFVNYILTHLTDHLGEYFLNRGLMMFDRNIPLSQRIEYIHSVVENIYVVNQYGLRTRKIGAIEKYLEIYEAKKNPIEPDFFSLEIRQSELLSLQDQARMVAYEYILDVVLSQERHLVYAPLLEKVRKTYERGGYQYEYPIVCMVTTGGLGPEGKGFVYLTPRGEIVEVCSDAKQTKAYVIEYKQYLKSIFLQKLENRMKGWHIIERLRNEILNFLNEHLQSKIVDFQEVENIKLEELIKALPQEVQPHITRNFLEFLEKSLFDILLPVEMEDQFKARMDLIKNHKLKETEIAKLASLGNISHYDVLDQRFFFLILIENMKRILQLKGII